MADDTIPNGSRVKVLVGGMREAGGAATVLDYDPATEWYFVQFDEGPPWRGRYERSELEAENDQ